MRFTPHAGTAPRPGRLARWDERHGPGAIPAALARFGFAGEEVDSAAEALRRLLYEDYALACIDLHMPVIDGVQLLRLLRARGNRVPVVVVTATGDMGLLKTTLKLGAADYIDVAAVGSALGRRYGLNLTPQGGGET